MKIKRMIFVILFFFILIILGGYALITQEKSNISFLEKRELSYIKPLSINNWLSKEFQESVDSSISDNFLERNNWLKYYNKTNMELNTIGNKILLILFNGKLDQRYSIQKVNERISYIKEISYLIRNPYTFDETFENAIKNNIKKINSLADKYKGVRFYIYIPTMANETNIFDTDVQRYNYMDIFHEATVPVKKLEIHNIYEFKKMYFKTDHHWSHIGSYQGYTDILGLLFDGHENPRIPIKEVKFDSVNFYGSHSRAIAHSIELEGDSISKYIFDLPEYKLYINGELTEEYGHYNDYVKGDIDNTKDFDHYNWMYQRREAEIIFVTNQEERDNILVISDSYSNAIRDTLASHFNKSIFINLDQYQRTYGIFEIEEYLNKYNVDKVLVMVVLTNYFPDGELKYLKSD